MSFNQANTKNKYEKRNFSINGRECNLGMNAFDKKKKRKKFGEKIYNCFVFMLKIQMR